MLVKDIVTGTHTDSYGTYPNSSNPQNLTDVNGTLFFTADDGETGRELWKSNGTASGTVLVKDINSGTDGAFTDDSPLIAVGNLLLFAADDGTHGDELWRSNGTSSGTVLVKDINPGSDGNLSYYNGFTELDGTLYFSAKDDTHGRELWKSDGTAAGTVLVKDINPGSDTYGDEYASYPFYMGSIGDMLYFSGKNATTGRELWQSDGTEAGTVLVADVVSGTGGLYPSALESVNGILVFSGDEGTGGELWVLDPEGVSSVRTARLTIYVDSEEVEIPEDVGVYSDETMGTAFTTDDSGKLYFDSQAATTLDDFFDIWRTNGGLAGNNADAVLDADQLMDNVASGDNTVKMFVNGDVSAEFEDYVLQNGDEIVLVFGSNPVVSLNTNYGALIIELFEHETPGTVANFLKYVNDGDYQDSFFHRSVTDFVIQGGGFTTTSTTFSSTSQFSEIPTDSPITNEPGISNLRGTVAMAKLGGDPDSATSQFFVNLSDDNTFLDEEANNSFTVFGQVLDMATVNEIAALPISTTNDSPYDELPLSTSSQLAVIESIDGEGDLSGRSFEDLDYDGVQDSGESSIAGVTVFADANDDGVLDADEYRTTTDSQGDWELRLPAGTWIIRQETTSGLYPTTVHGTGGHAVTVEIGGEVADLDFSNIDNAPPEPTADSYSVNEDATLTVSAADGLLDNDTDQDGDDLTAVFLSDPTNGTLTFGADGSFSYVPDDDFHGTDTFTYRAQDTYSQSAAVTVTITVESQPDDPTAVNDAFTVEEGDETHELDILDNDTTEPDGSQTLTITRVTQGSEGGVVTIDGSKIDYAPEADFTGTETFTYTIEDTDGLTDQATVTMTVESAVANNPGSISGYVYCDLDNDGKRDAGELGVQGAMLFLSGEDEDGNSVSESMLTPYGGFYKFDDLAPGTYEVTEQQPTALLDGKDTIGSAGGTVDDDAFSEIELTLGEDSTSNNFGERGLLAEYVTLRMFLASTPPVDKYLPMVMADAEEAAGNTDLADAIREAATEDAENDAPAAEDDEYTVEEDDVLTVTVSSGVLDNDSDPENDDLTATVYADPSHGSLTLNADGSFTYTPDSGYTGTDSFSYRANDGELDSNAATVTITVTSANDAPTAEDDAYTVEEDDALTVTVSAGVLDNDSDPENDDLTATVYADPSHGDLTLDSDGSFTYTPDSGYVGTDSFTYRASDGELNSNVATVTITVTSANDAPTAEDDAYTVDEDESLTVNAASGVLDNDTDPEDDGLTSVVHTHPSHGTLSLAADGSFVYTPNANFHGTDSFTYTANDGTDDSGTATVTITVNAVNDAPEATADDYELEMDDVLDVTAALGVLANDTDADDDDLTASLISTTSHGTLSLDSDGSFTYTPETGYYGEDSFSYKAYDGVAYSDTVVVTIVVNDAPTATDDSYTIDEDTTLAPDAESGVLANDTDPNDNALTATIIAYPSSGTLDFYDDGSFSYTPYANFEGVDTFTYKAYDGLVYSELATVTITVEAVNDAPVAVDDAYSVTEGLALEVDAASGVLVNDYDVEDDDLTAVVAAYPSNGTLTLSADGSFSYTPDQDFVGTDSYTYTVNDGSLDSEAATVTITVVSAQGPTAVDDAFEVEEQVTLTVIEESGVLANDLNLDAGFEAVLVDDVANGSLTLDVDGSFTYTPDDGFTGAETFTYKVSDGVDESNVATVTITVTEHPDHPENDAPVAVDDEYSLIEGGVLVRDAEAGAMANDYDVDGSPATVLTSLVITEINYNPSDPTTEELEVDSSLESDDFEFIELENVGDETIDLTGVEFSEGVLFNFSDGGILELEPGEVVLVVNDAVAFEARYGDELNVAGEFTGSLSNGGERIVLENASETTILDFTYDDEGDWPTEPDGDGYTLEVVDVTGDYGDPANWASSDELGGTPGEGTEATVDVSDVLVASVVDEPSHGELLLYDDGSFVYEPDDDFSGVDTFTYRLNDGGLDSNVATVTITVEGVNDAPAGEDDEYEVDENNELEVDADSGVLANDFDADGSPASALNSLVITEINYNPYDVTEDEQQVNPDFDNDDFEFIELENVGDQTIDLTGVRFTEGTAFDFSGGDVTELAPGETVLVVANLDAFEARYGEELNVAGEFGTRELNNGGETVVLVDSADNTIHEFTYDDANGWPTEADGAGSTLEVVDVEGDYDDPANWDASDDEGGTPGTGSGQTVDRDTLLAILVDEPEHGELEFNDDGSFTYTPDEDFGGTDTFTYRASDGAAESELVEVTIYVASVNDAPETVIDEYQVDEDGQLDVDAGGGVLANDTDADGSPASPLTSLVVTEINYNPYDPTDDELEVDADLDNDDFEFVELQNVSDQTLDLTGIQFTDGITFDFTGGSVSQLLPGETVLVVSNQSAFEIRYGDELNVAGEFALGLSSGGETIRLADADDATIQEFTYDDEGDWPAGADGDGSTLEVVDVTADYDDPTNWVASEELGGTPGEGADQIVDVPDVLTAELVSGPSHGELEFEDDGSFVYTPDEDFGGTDTFTYKASDGELESAVTEVTITVNAVNDAPTTGTEEYEVDEDGELVVDAENGVLANDSDVDGSPDTPLSSLAITEVNYNPYDPTDDELVVDSEFVSDDFEFIELQNVGDQTIDLEGVEFTEGITFDFSNLDVTELAPNETILVVANESAFEARYGDALNVAGEFDGDLSDDGEQITLEDIAGETIVQFTYDDEGGWPTDPDGDGSTLEVVDVTADYNDPDNWTASEESGGSPGTAPESTVDLNTLVAVVLKAPLHGNLTLNDDGSFTYEPEADFSGADDFMYRASDGDAESDGVTVNITVHPVNDAPVAVDDDYEVAQDGVLTVDTGEGVLDNDSDVDGSPATPLDSLVITEINYNPHDPTAEELAVDSGLDNDDFEFIELQNVGEETIDLSGVYFAEGVSFTFSDGTELAPGETVLVVRDAFAFTIRYGTEMNIAGEYTSGDLSNAGETIVLKDSADRTIQEFTYDDAGGWPTAPDGDGKTLEVVDVTGDYDDLANWIASEQLGGTPGEGTDTTVAVDYLMALLVDGPDHGELTLNEDGSFEYTPEAGYSGFDSFTYKASDGADESEEATVEIEVIAPGG